MLHQADVETVPATAPPPVPEPVLFFLARFWQTFSTQAILTLFRPNVLVQSALVVQAGLDEKNEDITINQSIDRIISGSIVWVLIF